MDIRNCRLCGRIFNYMAGPITCQVCRESMEAKFQEVKEYIRTHPGVGIPEVSAACDVEPSQIRQWLRDERLEVTEDSPIYLTCDGCGGPIRSGTLCEKCKMNTAAGFRDVIQKSRPVATPPKVTKPDNKSKMRYLQDGGK